MKQCCKNCRFAKLQANIRGTAMMRPGTCLYPIEEQRLPEVVTNNYHRTAIWPDTGTECLVWEFKVVA